MFWIRGKEGRQVMMQSLRSIGRWILTYLSPATCSVPCQVGSRTYSGLDFLDPKLSTLGHVVMIILWYGLIIAYGALVTYQWAKEPDAKVLTQEGAESYPPVQLYIQAACTNDPNCGNITVRAKYDGAAAGRQPPCASSSPQPILAAGQWVTLCPTRLQVLTTQTTQPVDATGVVIDFSRINPGYNATDSFADKAAQGVVWIYGDDASSEGVGSSSLIRVVSIASWQVKSLLVGQSVLKQMGSSTLTSSSVFASATQYEGRYPNWRATLVLNLEQYVNVVTVEKKGAQLQVMRIFSLVAGWLGIVWVLKALFPYAKPYFFKFFPSGNKN